MGLDSIGSAKQASPARGDEDILTLVLRDLKDRSDAGEKKYGVRLKSWNGRSPRVDAYQEVLDLAMYLRQGIEEERLIMQRLESAIEVMRRCKQKSEPFMLAKSILVETVKMIRDGIGDRI